MAQIQEAVLRGPEDRPLIEKFVSAYQTLQAAALDHPERLTTTADNGKGLEAWFFGEGYDVAFTVPSADVIAAGGLVSWYRRRQLTRLPTSITVDVFENGEQYPVSVRFGRVGTGRMYDPDITGVDRTPPPGALFGERRITSRRRLLDCVQAVVDMGRNSREAVLSFEQPGQYLSHTSFVGNERSRFTELLGVMKESFPKPETPPDRMPRETVTVNDLGLNDSHSLVYRTSDWGINLRIVPKPGYAGDLPPLTIDYTGREKPRENPLYTFHDLQRHYLELSRAQREELLGILTDQLRPDNFVPSVTTEELLRPHAGLLAACARLIPEGKASAKHHFIDTQTGEKNVLHIAVNTGGAYTVGVHLGNDGGLTIVSFDRNGLDIRAGLNGGKIDEAIVLKIYQIIQAISTDRGPKAE